MTPRLLVSVRSADEAVVALAGGAGWIDVKEPERGPMGPADPAIWRAVRAVVPMNVPMSVALGEAADWIDDRSPIPWPTPDDYAGIGHRKLGLAGMSGSPDWRSALEELVDMLGEGPRWVVAAYADSAAAHSPPLAEAIDWAVACDAIAGLLIDTWDKAKAIGLGCIEPGRFAPLRRAGKLIAVAGGLDGPAIAALRPLHPDLFAVRGAACEGGRLGPVDSARVAALARAVAG